MSVMTARLPWFFAAALGWQPLDRPNNIPMAAAWLQIAPGQELHLVEVADFEPSPFEREYGRHIALSYPQTDFVGLKQRLQRVQIDNLLVGGGFRAAAA